MGVKRIASTGAKIYVWSEKSLFGTQLADHAGEAQTCLAVDLFAVIADTPDLDLGDSAQTLEAVRLAEQALRDLAPRL